MAVYHIILEEKKYSQHIGSNISHITHTTSMPETLIVWRQFMDSIYVDSDHTSNSSSLNLQSLLDINILIQKNDPLSKKMKGHKHVNPKVKRCLES